MARIIISVEGQTEEEFVNSVVCPHLIKKGFIGVSARLMGNSRARKNRGGVRNWQAVKKEVHDLLLQDPGSLVGLIVDYYALPNSWPGRAASAAMPFDQKASAIQQGLLTDLVTSGLLNAAQRFRPLVMMHEFEAITFIDGKVVDKVLGTNNRAKIEAIRQNYATVEMINDSSTTAPSKRIAAICPTYNKVLHGNQIARQLGIEEIAKSCPNFDNWLQSL